jgi:SAM-dependent methyltransferase
VTATFDPLFGALAGDGWFPSPAHVMRRAAILDAFGAYPAGRLLEMGCGAGRLVVDWHRLGHQGEAVDLDPTARSLAARCIAAFGADFSVAERPQSALFDYLVATEVLEHVEHPDAVLEEWLRYLKPGGVFLATVPAFQCLWGRSDEWAGHVQRFEPADFRRLAEKAGLEVLETRLYGYPVGNLLRMAGNVASDLKMRRRKAALGREDATYASGHDRSVENKLAPLLRSFAGRAMLRAAIGLQRRVNKGHGLLLVARKPAAEALACAA